MHLQDLSKRIQQLVEQSKVVLSTSYKESGFSPIFVDSGKLAGLRVSVLSFIAMAYGKEHSHYSEFDKATRVTKIRSSAEKGHEILLAIQNEIEGGWIFSVKKLVSAEIFSDFLEMAAHLLELDYKDPAAVMIGSVLEENLRQLCHSAGIETEIEKEGTLIPKSADRLNSDLAKAEGYTKLDQKSVTAWLDLRNKAAHGKYNEYGKEQVELMMRGVTEFLARMNA